MDNLLVEVKLLKKDFINNAETLNILKGIDFTLTKGESVSITGESGSGKSTFLNTIGGLDNVSDGSIKIEGTEITSLDEEELTFFRNKRIGFIFQSHYLLEEFNSLENVMIPFLINNFNTKKAKEKAKYLLDIVGVSNRMSHYPSQLSGGERQRVAIARAFINDPSLILADEPTGNLDEKNSNKVLELLFSITQKEKHALIMVTHSQQIAKMTEKNYHLEAGILNLV
ncbi:MAG: lipoprotein ABC transporter ATP-binding protein [Spirochaetes bacterium GWD1_27_9]|nr:MAG: lipoprotein ABC transporter ATP-binding protein [Spirochaetes bacterium GWB1_27_13]OHD28074.1 MAG: lipoprotein ABC transporter ATP-binding protein [Spirochaetes bacterium GWC1_27_15]OHD32557.1 MAG: lipoprotein ABC transporter ATP-binding protein [Spirochaetes bacterium GWD1_27_9]